MTLLRVGHAFEHATGHRGSLHPVIEHSTEMSLTCSKLRVLLDLVIDASVDHLLRVYHLPHC